MTFPEWLRAEILRLGQGTAQAGEQLVAIVCSGLRPMSARTVRRMANGETLPTKAEEVGMRILLAKAKPLPPKYYPAKSAPQ